MKQYKVFAKQYDAVMKQYRAFVKQYKVAMKQYKGLMKKYEAFTKQYISQYLMVNRWKQESKSIQLCPLQRLVLIKVMQKSKMVLILYEK